MPRYFLHIRDSVDLTEDPDGSNLPDLDAARVEAIAAARELLSEAILKGELPLEHKFEIADEAGRPLLTVPFREAIAGRRLEP